MKLIPVASLAAVVTLSACSSGEGSTPQATHSISGTVSGAAAESVTVSLGGAATATTTTDASGNYSFTGLADGSYTVTPSMTGFSFSPVSIAVTLTGADVTAQDFTVSSAASTHAISGTMSGDIAGGVTITLGGDGSGATTTGANGKYTFSGIPNGSYTLTPSMVGFTFSPTSLSLAVNGTDVSGQDFTSTFSGLALTVVTSTLPQGTVGHAYNANVVAMGGLQPYVFSGAGLPSWLTLATDGTLFGTPTAAGTFPFTVTVTDDNGTGNSASRNLSITVVGH